jgi:ubiquinol-cytochrome c reductase subunit 8
MIPHTFKHLNCDRDADEDTIDNLFTVGDIRVGILQIFWSRAPCLPSFFVGIPKQKDIAIYALCANRQRPLAGAAHNAVFNTARRTRSQALYVVPPFVLAYLLLSWAEEKWVEFFSFNVQSQSLSIYMIYSRSISNMP